uniref:hypothetical protein n=1 Tax=Barnesiella intestinihominis TaxID=487174 RepID=UPI003FED756C
MVMVFRYDSLYITIIKIMLAFRQYRIAFLIFPLFCLIKRHNCTENDSSRSNDHKDSRIAGVLPMSAQNILPVFQQTQEQIIMMSII